MTLKEAIQILENYNIWRRGDIEDYVLKSTPKEIGIALDTVITHYKKQLLANTLSEMGALECEKNIKKHKLK